MTYENVWYKYALDWLEIAEAFLQSHLLDCKKANQVVRSLIVGRQLIRILKNISLR